MKFCERERKKKRDKGRKDMEELIIKNIGPIREAKIRLNKINLFIGPQSSGKSTIAKLVSFCQWLEKHIIVNQSTVSVNASFIKERLVDYYGFRYFFSEDSYLEYRGKTIKFIYRSSKDFSVEIVGDLEQGCRSEIAYIPSERNVVSLPNMSTFPMEDNYIRSFVFNWLSLRTKYSPNNHYNVLDLDVDYFYNDKTDGDVVRLRNGKEIRLSESSSGLQAVIPLLVYVNYATKWIYANDADISYDNYTSLQRAVIKGNVGEEAIKMLERLKRPHSTKLIIEESEMNIFPSTQYQLMKKIFETMDFERGDTLLLTTHSPYIMTSINNLIQAGNKAKNGNAVEVEKIIPKESWIDYKDVSAWAVEYGGVVSINDDEFEMISANALDTASDEIAEDFSKLL